MDLQKILKEHKLWLETYGDDGERADLTHANLRDVNLSNVYLSNADLGDADLRYADLGDVKIDYQIQDGLLKQIADIVLKDNSKLHMYKWHTCETTHCLAGWACHLNEAAKELEKTHGTQMAGLLTLGEEAHSYFFERGDEAIQYLKGKNK